MGGIFAAEQGCQVLILEKGKKPGVKILMSGGTRCNITHHCDNRGIVEAFGKNGQFLHSALAAFSPSDVVNFFNAEGLATKVEDTGKIFPVSDRALDVLTVLLKRLHRSGAELAIAEPALDVQPNGTGFRVMTPRRAVTCAKLLITTGGLSYPGCGTTGDGYTFAKTFGHSIVPTAPALVPLRTHLPWVSELKGLTLPHVNLNVQDGNVKPLVSRAGAMLFAHFGLTGPAPLDVSRAVSRHASPNTTTLQVDLLPQHTEQQLDVQIQTLLEQHGKKHLAVVLSDLLPRRMCDELLQQSQLPLDRRAAGLSKADRRGLVQRMKALPIPLMGTLGYEKAEVTSGGVSLHEVESKTMQSRLQPNLYFAGEVLDLDGWIGGYNFQSAWSTGALAARSLAAN
jgi:hypothetical protein